MPPKKPRTIYVCQSCGAQSPRWAGRCAECNAWNSLVETIEPDSEPQRRRADDGAREGPVPLSAVRGVTAGRLHLPIREMESVLGGGIVPGSVVLVSGDPGIGKSTLLLQTAAAVAAGGGTVLYVSGEESADQLRLRAERLGVDGDRILVLAETSLDTVLEEIRQAAPSLVIVDSIQTMYLETLASTAGSVAQVRECAMALLRLAKATRIPVFLVGHVTKEGTIAGPMVLEHIVDVVLYLEGERYHTYRLLRSVKNRFGSTNEVGVFEMREEGMVEVENPSAVFLAERLEGPPGSAVAVTLEGTRPILVEIQALTSLTSFGLPRRNSNGVEFNRLVMLAAVLTKQVGLPLANQDIHVNVVGGFRVGEPAADLAIALAVASSYRERPVIHDLAAIGEIGLAGDVRRISHVDRRLAEAGKLGFTRCLLPATVIKDGGLARLAQQVGVELIGVRTVAEALARGLAPRVPSGAAAE